MTAIPNVVAAAGGIGSAVSQTRAVVNVGAVTDDYAVFVETNDDGMIADYTIVNKYLFDPGVYTNGVTSPGGFNGLSVSFVQLRSATLLWLADWTALKGGAVPEIPDPFSVSPDWTLLEVMPEMPAVVPASDGVLPLYRVSGRYIYAHNKPSKTIYDQLNFPRLPTQPNVFSRSIPLSKLTDQLINGIGPASTGSSTSFPNVPSLGENIISS